MGQLMITQEGYEEIKGKLKNEFNKVANSFIVIGYLLKQVRDSGAYVYDGYRNLEEFAQGEYKISASTASRFMDINTKFSEDGNSMQIREEYSNYGYSKLQEMLTVKENDMELITPETTVAQIREIKNVEREEDKEEEQREAENLPLVKMTEEAEPAAEQEEPVATSQKAEYSPLEQTLIDLWKTQPADLLCKIRGGMIGGEELAEELSPSGSKTFTSGTYMLFMYTYSVGVKFRYYGDGKANVVQYTYDQIIEITNNVINDELFQEITSPKSKQETQSKQESIVQKPVEKNPPVEKPAQEKDEENTYKPLPGQMTFTDTAASEPAEQSQEPDPAAEVQDAEYRELPNEEEYSQIEIDNAIGYFETEYNRMAGMGINSTKCRNYKMALDAIRKVYGHETEE